MSPEGVVVQFSMRTAIPLEETYASLRRNPDGAVQLYTAQETYTPQENGRQKLKEIEEAWVTITQSGEVPYHATRLRSDSFKTHPDSLQTQEKAIQQFAKVLTIS